MCYSHIEPHTHSCCSLLQLGWEALSARDIFLHILFTKNRFYLAFKQMCSEHLFCASLTKKNIYVLACDGMGGFNFVLFALAESSFVMKKLKHGGCVLFHPRCFLIRVSVFFD